MSGTVEEIASTIKKIVEDSGQILGSRLSTELKVRVPGWDPADFGLRSLREFVTTHVEDVVVAGRSGMDVLYALKRSVLESPTPSTAPPPEVDFWRVWVSPNSPHALAVDRIGAALSAVPRGSAVPSSQVLVEPPGVDAHRDVAKAFLPRVPEPLRAKLRAVLDSPSEAWWQAWLRELRGTEYLSTWNTLRRQQFEDRLAARLTEASLDQTSIEGVLKFVRERHAAALPRSRRSIAVEVSLRDGEDAAIRRLVIEAVHRMSASELRELRLPLGIVLDALGSSKSR
ncbi:MAG: hypothetical protein WBY94_25190 [Polyangiaceae bacterium]